jgi:hypothetical protein
MHYVDFNRILKVFPFESQQVLGWLHQVDFNRILKAAFAVSPAFQSIRKLISIEY